MALPASPPFIFFSKELFVMRVKSSAVEGLLNEQFFRTMPGITIKPTLYQLGLGLVDTTQGAPLLGSPIDPIDLYIDLEPTLSSSLLHFT